MPKSLSDEELKEQVFDEVEEDFGDGLENETPDDPPEETPEVLDEVPEDVEEQEEVESVSVRSLAEKYGLPFEEAEDDVEALDRFFGKIQQFAQQTQARDKQYQDQLRLLQHQIAQQQQAPPPQQAPTPQSFTGLLKHWEKVPEWSDDWLTMVKRDENGELVAKPGADPTLPQKIAARTAWEERAQRSLIDNPQQFIYEAFQANPTFQTAIQEQIQQAVYVVQNQMEAQRVADQMRPYLHNEDGSLNDAGRAYMNSLQYAQQNLNVWDTQRLHQIALQAATPYLLARQTEAPPESKKKRQLSFAKQHSQRKVNSGQSAEKRAKAKSRPKDSVDLERAMLEGLAEMGVDLNARM